VISHQNYQNELNALALMLADTLVYKCPSMQCQDVNCYVSSMLRSNAESIHMWQIQSQYLSLSLMYMCAHMHAPPVT